jgi:hypothetical protein
MKKITTFLFGSLLALTAMAQYQPTVIVNSSSDLEVRIDGNKYSKPETNNTNMIIPNMTQGSHTLEVYRVSGGILGIGKKRDLLSRTSFNVGNNDITINIDQNGQARISERNSNGTTGTRTDGNSNTDIGGRTNRGRTDNTWNKGRDRDDDVYDSNGKKVKKAKHNNGKKKGHYKNGKISS